MKKIKITRIATLIVVVLATVMFNGCDIDWMQDDFEYEQQRSSYSNIIAHAGGGVDGLTYLNSVECIEENYPKGISIYEYDFLMSEEGDLIGTHCWESWAVGEGYWFDNRMTLEEYENTAIRGGYTGMTFTNLLHMMQDDYTDITIIIDTKESNKELFYEQLVSEARAVDINLLDRIIPYVYSPSMYNVLEEIYQFPTYMYAIYQIDATNEAVYDFLNSHEKIRTLAVGDYRADSMSASYIQSLYEIGKRVFVHTLDSFEDMDIYVEKGIDGFISNFISEEAYDEHYGSQ